MFQAHVLIVRRAKLYITVSGIITPIGGRPVHRLGEERTGTVLSQPVHGTATYRCDDTRDCVIQFCPPDDEHMCLKHVEAWNKLITKFSASSWLLLINKYIEMHGQQNIKKEESSLETGMAKFSSVFFQVSSHKHLKENRWINLFSELIHKSEIFS